METDVNEVRDDDRKYLGFDVKSCNILQWHGALYEMDDFYRDGHVVKIDRETAAKIRSGKIDKDQFAYFLKMGGKPEDFGKPAPAKTSKPVKPSEGFTEITLK